MTQNVHGQSPSVMYINADPSVVPLQLTLSTCVARIFTQKYFCAMHIFKTFVLLVLATYASGSIIFMEPDATGMCKTGAVMRRR